jgi:hypothetical protein
MRFNRTNTLNVKAYFDKLAPAMKKTLIYNTTGPKACVDVHLTFPPLLVVFYMK